MSYKIGIVGAARRHQGTGPFIARIFNQLGHRITGIIGTTRNSAADTCTHLEQQYGIKTQGYTCLEDLLSEHEIDALVISSPPATHLNYLEKALAKKLHVFCEKPLWWPARTGELIAEQEYLANIQHCLDMARQNHCLIHLNTQWTYTLADFYRLYPDIDSTEIKHFSMNLSPQSQGESMLIDAASHGLSMLYQLVGQGEITDTVVTHASTEQLMVSFGYTHQAGLLQVDLGFIQSQEIPKPASYIINNCRVDRIVSLPEYQIKLQSDERCVAIRDPLLTSVEDFIASLQAGLQTDATLMISGCRHLYQLIKCYK